MAPSFPRLCLALPLLLAAASAASARPARPAQAADGSANAAVGEFAFDLYRALAAENTGKNVFCSPYSIANALAMAAEGARGETALEMGQALRFPKSLRLKATLIPWDTEPIHSGLAALNKRFSGDTAGVELSVANALWVDRKCLLRKAFLNAMTTHYRGGVYGVDLKNDQKGACRQINAWAEKLTGGKVKGLVAEDTRLEHLIITNAIHFKGEWDGKFSADDTKDAPFVLAGGTKADVKTMTRKEAANVRYGAFEGDGTFFASPKNLALSDKQKLYPDARGFAVLEMPYKGGEVSMVLIAPNSEDGLGAVEKLLSPANLAAWLGKLEKRATHVQVPKFTLRTEYDAARALQGLGMKRAFADPLGKGGAEFEGMTASNDPRDKVFLTRVVHKAFVEVNEEGTRAAAATAVTGSRSIGGPFIPTFKADRPFVFLIRDGKTGTVLFIGRVTDPRPKG